MALVDADGPEAFSFRTLAAGLGCQAMSIYHYFPSKAHLFEALVDVLIAEAMAYEDLGNWQTRLRAAAQAYRRMALRHPGMFLYFASFRLNSRAGLGFLERMLRILQDAGLPPEPRARHFRILGHYLMGACLGDAVRGPASSHPVPFEEARQAFPGLMAVGPHLVADRQGETFLAGLSLLIQAIERDVAPGPPKAP